MSTLASQMLTIAVIALQRQLYHNRGLNRTSWKPSYDFVVVGGGTAGSIVAGRLTENPTINVLLLEAGGPLTISTDMLSNTFTRQNDYNWNYFTTPQKNSGLFC